MHKAMQGPVIWNGDKCIGCRYCMIPCPFDSPKFEYQCANPKIEKCTMCYGRLTESKVPDCVDNCLAGALVFGKRRDLIKEALKNF
jgi:Fe-S-cluster-containing dehydrogenase component